MNAYYIKCTVCGRFCKPADSGIPFGNSYSTEPPDEEYYCQRCVEDKIKYYVEHKRVPLFWLKPNWTLKIAEILGYVQISPEHAAWSVWHKKEIPLPEGYRVLK